jgi:ubiquinone/menaquinone biosynthesis C-methylase UbiE
VSGVETVLTDLLTASLDDRAREEAVSLPVPDRSVDAIVSVFGVIFAPDAEAAAVEMARVLRPGGRIVLSAWLREGALAEQARMRAGLASSLTPATSTPLAFDHHCLG